MRLWSALVLLLPALGASVAGASPQGRQAQAAGQAAVIPAGLDRLHAQIERAVRAARGNVGVAVRHLETGAEVYVNADESYPMASTVKLPVLIELYAKAKAGQLDWDEIVDIGAGQRVRGSGELFVLFDPPGVRLSLHNIANLMMIISDNSAADICFARAGKDDVNQRLEALGVKGMRVDRMIAELLAPAPRDAPRPPEGAQARPETARPAESRPSVPAQARTDEARWAAADQLAADPRDQATPRAFVTILEKLWRGEVVDSDSSAAILETMKRCTTGALRIKGLLPQRTVVAHKTGSLNGVYDDVGIVYLPDGAGHLAMAVLSKSVRAPSEDAERVIAEVARYAYDYFYFTAPATSAGSDR